MIQKVIYCLFLFFFVACTNNQQNIKLPYTKSDFEMVVDGKQTTLVKIMNKNGMFVTITNYGARIVSLFSPDKNGEFDDVVLGCPSLAGYINGNPGVGATIGPYANRISNASFKIDGLQYQLPMNKKDVCHHSGPDSFYRQVWEISLQTDTSVTLSIISHDGQWGFPGNKKVDVTYVLTEDNSLIINYIATTDKACYFNLTNHSYFNLKGKGTILNHILEINANQITTYAGESLTPSGEINDIRGSDLDFTKPTKIGERICSSDPQMVLVNGYDHNYILNKPQDKDTLTFCASIYEPITGRYMECYTTEPAVQFYTANFLDGKMMGKYGEKLRKRTGLCLETQHYPDSPHHKSFPNTLLIPGDTLKSQTIFNFYAMQ